MGTVFLGLGNFLLLFFWLYYKSVLLAPLLQCLWSSGLVFWLSVSSCIFLLQVLCCLTNSSLVFPLISISSSGSEVFVFCLF
jgi:hypothetical protein